MGQFVVYTEICGFKYYLQFHDAFYTLEGLIDNATHFNTSNAAKEAAPTDPRFEVHPIGDQPVYKKIPLPHRLKELRAAMGHTQHYVADALNLHIKTYQAYEQGNAFPTNDGIISLAKFFNITIEELIKGKRIIPDFVLNLNC
jgi:DNA-binding XRE family transcriptional regulator